MNRVTDREIWIESDAPLANSLLWLMPLRLVRLSLTERMQIWAAFHCDWQVIWKQSAISIPIGLMATGYS